MLAQGPTSWSALGELKHRGAGLINQLGSGTKMEVRLQLVMLHMPMKKMHSLKGSHLIIVKIETQRTSSLHSGSNVSMMAVELHREVRMVRMETWAITLQLASADRKFRHGTVTSWPSWHESAAKIRWQLATRSTMINYDQLVAMDASQRCPC